MKKLLLTLALVVIATSCTTTPSAIPFSIQPVDKSLTKCRLGMRGTSRKKGAEYHGQIKVTSNKSIAFKAYSSSGNAKPDKLVIDWNGNNDFADEVVIPAPTKTVPQNQTGTIDGKQQKVTIVRLPYGGFYITILPAEWQKGQIAIDGIIYNAAILDLDYNGIETKGRDILLLDLNHDGKFAFQGGKFEGQMALSRQILLQGGVYKCLYNDTLKQVNLTPITDAGTVNIINFLEADSNTLAGWVPVQKKYLQFKTTGSSFKVPTGKYKFIHLVLEAKKGDKLHTLSFATKPLDIKANKTLDITLSRPTGVVPKVRQVGKNLKIKHQLVFEKAAAVTRLDFRLNNRRVPAPSIIVYRGNDILAQGSMEYG